ncbi:MAG: SpoIIE family protein phosphatase [Chlorobi bacterium]|nr:SpoIIE family protein phosphatase [Chlorobiota bacterium]
MNKIRKYTRKTCYLKTTFYFLVATFFLGTLIKAYPAESTGTPLISHFTPPEDFNTEVRAVSQDGNGNLYLANRQGILWFDGISWKLLPEIRQVYSLHYDAANERIWVGGNGYIGYLNTKNDIPGPFHMISVSDSLSGKFDHILTLEENLIFCSEQSIVSVSPDIRASIMSEAGDHVFTGFFIHRQNLYVNIEKEGLTVYTAGKLVPVDGGKRFQEDIILFGIGFDRQHTLFATDNSFLYLFDGQQFSDYIPEDEEYLFNRILTHAVLFDDTTLILGTRNGGCLILDKRNRKTRYIINYQSGLPDNEILSLGRTADQELIIGHIYGFSMVNLTIPVKSYNVYPGLEGNILTLLPEKGHLLVGTSEGIFLQKQIKEYEKSRIMVRVRVPFTDTTSSEKTGETQHLKQQTVQKPEVPRESEAFKKQSFFSRIFGKRKTGEEVASPEKPIATPQLFPKTTQKHIKKVIYRYVPKYIYKFKSITYRYKKLGSLNARCTKLVPFGGQILAATNAGLYSIRNEKVEFVFMGTQVYDILPDPVSRNVVFCGTEDGVYLLKFSEGRWQVDRDYFPSDLPVYSIIRDGKNLWLGSESGALRLTVDNETLQVENVKKYLFPTTYPQPVISIFINGSPAFLMKEGWYDFNPEMQKMILHADFPGTNQPWLNFIRARENVWIKGDEGWFATGILPDGTVTTFPYLNIFNRITGLQADTDGNLWVIVNHSMIYKLEPGTTHEPLFHVRVKEMVRSGQTTATNFFYTLLQPSGETRVTFSAPWFLQPSKTEYQYMLEGFGNVWSEWNTGRQITIPYLPPGDYVLHYRARNVLGGVAEGEPVPLHIPVPFWQRWWFILTVFLVVIFIIWGIIRIRLHKLEKDRRLLEEKVRKRTAEIRKQKEKIEAQRDEIARQKQDITDSIAYAQRIQKALLPPEHMIEKLLPEHFILFRPRDIVSGDFYWIRRSNNHIVVAAADCTGHGVPGAFMSMLGSSFLNEIISRHKVLSAPDILNQLRQMVKEALHQTGRTYETKDGMDMALGVFDIKNHTLEFSGAYNPLYLIRNGKLTEYKADKMPIGVHIREDLPFSVTKIPLKDMDMIYMFSDGYVDQFGEKENKKFKSSRFKELLISISGKDAVRQRDILIETFEKWKGNLEQIDDILILGIRYYKDHR